MSEESKASIKQYTQKLLNNYDKIRGRNKDETLFWDAVIISASDENQKVAFEMQIAVKQKRGEIPVGVPFHVFPDPPGYKIGCGGSTMFVFEKLFEIYENSMYNMHLLLIPAGGYSQRLPNFSTLGKLFCLLPFGDSVYQMLDLILAMYLPFLYNMPPGIFLACSDAIISYSLSDDGHWTFPNEGFTALAHPSPVPIGTKHGVYVLPGNQDYGKGSMFMSDCKCVLQKPSLDKMQEKGAVVRNDNQFSTCEDEEIIFSDSAYFIDQSIMAKLLNFYKNSKPLKCELSSYGDFLQPLGSAASPSYIVDKITDEELAETRSALYQTLYDTPLKILVLKHSNFHHIGTMKEYLDSFCGENKFSEIFPVSRFSHSCYSVQNILPLYIDGSILHSIVHPLSNIPESSVVEYCKVGVVVDIGHNCIISNVQMKGFSIQKFPLSIPDNTLLHTIMMSNSYVTVAFGIKDDLKITTKSEGEIMYLGKKLKDVFRYEQIFTVDTDDQSLWTAKLFHLCNTPEESFKATMDMVMYVLDGVKVPRHLHVIYVSMKEISLQKNVEAMVKYQKSLFYSIKQNKSSS